MRRFLIPHLSVIFACCLVATSSYILFDLLDIDGSDFKDQAQVSGLEAVMPASGGGSKPTALDTVAPRSAFLCGSLLAARLPVLASRPVPSPLPCHFAVLPRKAQQRESTSLAREGDPARRTV